MIEAQRGNSNEPEQAKTESLRSDPDAARSVSGMRGLAGRTDPDLVAKGRLLANLEQRLFTRSDGRLRFGRYVLHDPIGMGALGVVYRAEDPELGRTVAIKFLRSDAPGRSATVARRGIVREARALGRANHPNIVPVFDVGTYAAEDLRLVDGEHRGGLFLVLEFIRGRTLRQWLDESTPSVAQILAAFVAAGEGLAAAHAVGVVHRDFKPDNVLVGDDGRVRVVDFGLAGWDQAETPDVAFVTLDSDVSEELARDASDAGATLVTDGIVGTPAYMAPEQHRGDPAAPSVDQFAFAVALYEALTGERPHHGATLEELARAKVTVPGELRSRRGRVSRRVQRAILRALAARPHERFGTMKALLEELRPGPSVPSVTRVGLGCGVLTGAALAAWSWGGGGDDARSCERAGASIALVWNEAVAGRVAERFEKSGLVYADRTWAEVEPRLDAYAREWRAARVALCEQGRQGSTSDRRLDASMACLQREMDRFEATVEVFLDADAAAIERGAAMVQRLEDPQRCEQPELDLPPDGIAAEVALLRRRLARIEAWREAGRYERAASAVSDVLRSAVAVDYPPLIAEATLARAQIQKSQGQPEAAESSAKSAYFMANQHGLDRLAARTSILLAYVVGDELARPDDGDRWIEHAQASLRRLEQDERLRVALTHARSLIAKRRGDYDEALELAREALAGWERVGRSEHPTSVAIWGMIGNSLYDQGRYAEARDAYSDALGLARRQFGNSHPRTADALANLALAHRQLGEFERALTLSKRALEIRQATLGESHARVAQSLHNLGELANALDDAEMATMYYERALVAWKTSVGVRHPSHAATLNNLGRVLWKAGRDREALARYEEALAVFLEVLGNEHPYVAVGHCNVGFVLLEQGRHDEAAPHFETCVAIREDKAVAPGHLAEARFGWAQALVSTDPRRAVELARRARREYEGAEPADPQAIAQIDDQIDEWLAERSR